MKYFQINNLPKKVSRICLGTMTFGEQNTEEEAHQFFDYAFEKGVNFIDTAEMYSSPARAETQGSSEAIIGNWMKERGNRKEIILATKITGPLDYFKYIRDPLNFSPGQIRAALEGSLRRLKTDYVDIYQLHWPERKTNFFGKLGFEPDPEDRWIDNFAEIIRTMNDLIREGKILHFGVSNETAWGLMHYIHLAEQLGLEKPVTIQNAYSLLNRTFEVGLAEVAWREQVPLLAYSPLGYGLLTGKYHNQSDVSHSRLKLFPQLSRYSNDRSYEAAGKYIALAKSNGLNPANMALAFILSRPYVASCIIGVTRMEHLIENLLAVDVVLSDDVLKAIDDIHHDRPNPAP